MNVNTNKQTFDQNKMPKMFWSALKELIYFYNFKNAQIDKFFCLYIVLLVKLIKRIFGFLAQFHFCVFVLFYNKLIL